MKTHAIIPVKRFEYAKQRLGEAVPAGSRVALAEAMFLDVLSHLNRSKRIDTIVVVTSDVKVARTARWLGVEVLEQEADEGHSEAASAGVKLALERGVDRVAMLPGDCPMLDPVELDRHLGTAPRSALIVPDRHGTGTNALLLSPPDAFEPAFGPDSCARHVSRARAAGVSFAVDRIDSLSLDLDTPEDLMQLRDALILRPELAPRTAQLIWELGPEQEPHAPAAA
ncbi:MAG: 2-phospho-L-lactate/phosphoenolpyruvate guanylyltransferase [Solirubrobacterales bacterium]|nr:2-phospho-L-lactate/phosphoenolpyruvate guanylyltransferase [Solirubrobacterales bacterium]